MKKNQKTLPNKKLILVGLLSLLSLLVIVGGVYYYQSDFKLPSFIQPKHDNARVATLDKETDEFLEYSKVLLQVENNREVALKEFEHAQKDVKLHMELTAQAEVYFESAESTFLEAQDLLASVQVASGAEQLHKMLTLEMEQRVRACEEAWKLKERFNTTQLSRVERVVEHAQMARDLADKNYSRLAKKKDKLLFEYSLNTGKLSRYHRFKKIGSEHYQEAQDIVLEKYGSAYLFKFYLSNGTLIAEPYINYSFATPKSSFYYEVTNSRFDEWKKELEKKESWHRTDVALSFPPILPIFEAIDLAVQKFQEVNQDQTVTYFSLSINGEDEHYRVALKSDLDQDGNEREEEIKMDVYVYLDGRVEVQEPMIID